MDTPDSFRVISNSSPLICLSRIDRLDILLKLFDTITIPEGVYQEVVFEAEGRPGSKAIQALCDQNKIVVREVENENLVTALSKDLDKGESEVITLALEIDHDLILLDESDARKMASFYHLKFTGFIGILLKAYHSGIINNFKSELDKAIMQGFYINGSLYHQLIKKAD